MIGWRPTDHLQFIFKNQLAWLLSCGVAFFRDLRSRALAQVTFPDILRLSVPLPPFLVVRVVFSQSSCHLI